MTARLKQFQASTGSVELSGQIELPVRLIAQPVEHCTGIEKAGIRAPLTTARIIYAEKE